MSVIEDILIKADSSYIEAQSKPENNHFVFSYTITIINSSTETVQLLSRHWLIKDSNFRIEEVVGEGVIGEQPILEPNQGFQYSSGAMLQTDVGTMEGFYHFKLGNNSKIKVAIPLFVLSVPRKIH